MRIVRAAVVLIFAMAVAVCSAADSPVLKATATRSEDRLDVSSEGRRAVVVIHSLRGIGDATIERTTEQWPDEVVIQLRLRGLESLRVSTDELKLEASVSTHDGTARLWKDAAADSPLKPTSPYWMEIRNLNGSRKPATPNHSIPNEGIPNEGIPNKARGFEMRLPKKIFESNPRVIRLAWIDFFRN